MYLTEETQLQILAGFYWSLKENGFLLLGNVENLITRPQRSLFTSIHRQSRIFTKVRDAEQSSPYTAIAVGCDENTWFQEKAKAEFGASVNYGKKLPSAN